MDNAETLLFNTYYNTLVANQEVDLNRLLGKETQRFSTPSTSTVRNNYKLKRVKWADEDMKVIRKRNNSTEPMSFVDLANSIKPEMPKFKVSNFHQIKLVIFSEHFLG